MNKRIEIPADKLNMNVCSLWSKDWLLLSAGDFAAKQYNMMTVGWGSFGVMWGKPFAMVVVRPQRFTRGFIEKSGCFTLCAFPEQYRAALSFCGAKSGRDFPDKAAAAGLSACASKCVSAPAYDEAELVVECSVNYRSAFDGAKMTDPGILEKWYPGKDLHAVYFGEILHISGTEKYLAR